MNVRRLYFAALVCICALAFAPAGHANCYNYGTTAPGCYGPGLGADNLANTQVGGPYNAVVSYRMVATHSGSLKSVLVYLIPDHAGYAGGTGGQIRVTVNTDDGTSAHNPSTSVIASHTITNYLNLTPSRYFPVITFDVPPTLISGQIYHIVFTNVDSSPTVNYLSVDGLYQYAPPAAATQPTMSDVGCAVLLKQAGNGWVQRPGYTPTIMMSYSDGWSDGIGYMEVWPTGAENVSGSWAVREVFTVTRANEKVASVSVRAARLWGSDPLVVHLEDANGNVMEEGYIPASSFPSNSEYDGWATYNFSSSHMLYVGQTYHLDIEASSSSLYQVFPIRKGYAFGFSSSTYFSDGHAEFKENGGSWYGWPMWGVWDRPDGDLQFYFGLSW